MLRDAFINGLLSQHICQRLLENTTLDLDATYRQARSLESVQRNSDVYSTQGTHSLNTVASPSDVSSTFNTPAVNAVNQSRKCYFCGNNITTDRTVRHVIVPIISVEKLAISPKCTSQNLRVHKQQVSV